MGGIFNPDNFIWKPLGRFFDVLMLSFLWLLCSLPVFTAGAATTALYDAVLRGLHRRERDIYRRFFLVFRREFRQATLAWLIGAPVWLLCWFGVQIWSYNAQLSQAAGIFAVAGYVLLLIPTGLLCWLFPLLSRFTYSLGGLFRTAFAFCFAHLPSTLLLAISLLATAWLCIRWYFPLLFLPALLMLLWARPVERAFEAHME